MKQLAIFLGWCSLTFLVSQLGHWILGFVVPFLIIPLTKIDLGRSLLYGFSSVFLVWFLTAAFIDLANKGMLSSMIGKLLGGLSSPILLLLTGLIGGIGGLLASWLAHQLRLVVGQINYCL